MKSLTENDFILLLGANLGDTHRHLADAIAQLAQQAELIASSSIHITPAWGKTDQPDFANQAVIVHSELEPLAFLHMVQEIEQQAGRVRTEKWGPRTLDIDIIFIGNRIIDLPQLQVPHPLSHERSFVLAPLNELIPTYVHPVLDKTVAALLEQLS